MPRLRKMADLRNLSAQGTSERLTPRGKLTRQATSQQLQQFILQLQFPLPLPAVDRAHALELVAAEAFQTLPIQILEIWDLADGCFNRIASALTALHNPLEHSHVLAVPRPDEFPIGIGTKPIDAEDARALRHRAPQLEPMVEVVTHVVTDKRDHCHRIAPHTPTFPVAAAVVSEPIVAAMYTPEPQSSASATSGTVSERR